MIFARSHTDRRRPVRRAAILLFCVIAVGTPLHSRAYQQYGVQVGNKIIKLKWNRMPVQYYIENVGIPGVSASQLQATVDAAFTTWHNVQTAAVSAQSAGYTTAQPTQDDGLSTIGFLADPQEPDVLGSTDWLIDDTTGEIVESDIFFNSAPVIPWSVAANGESGHFDLQSIATHEIGHFWGLGHSALGETQQVTGGRRVIAKAAVMFPIAYSPGNTLDRTLQPDDIAGISDLYPAGGFQSETGSVTGQVTKNGKGVFGAHVVAFSPSAGTLIGNFTLDNNGAFTISGLAPGPVILRVEPVDDADLDSFFDDPSKVDVNFTITYYGRFAIVPLSGSTPQIQIQVTPK
jgi:hypothetical protein